MAVAASEHAGVIGAGPRDSRRRSGRRHARPIDLGFDGITPLRELADAARANRVFLFTPPTATRVRWNMFSDTPLPPEEPAGQNPPDGAVLDYYLSAASSDVTLEIVDDRGRTVRRYSRPRRAGAYRSVDVAVPTLAPSAADAFENRGHYRFVWDLRYRRREERGASCRLPPSTTTPARARLARSCSPGRYTIRLIADSEKVERLLEVRMDPRVTHGDGPAAQTDLSLQCYQAYDSAQKLREAIDIAITQRPERREEWLAVRGSGVPENPDVLYDSITAVDPSQETLVGLQQKLLFMMNLLQSADARPTTQAVEAVKKLTAMVPALGIRWDGMR